MEATFTDRPCLHCQQPLGAERAGGAPLHRACFAPWDRQAEAEEMGWTLAAAAVDIDPADRDVRKRSGRHLRLRAMPDLVGHVFGRLTVVGLEWVTLSSGVRCRLWRLRCDCGTELHAHTFRLLEEHASSCDACSRKERGARRRRQVEGIDIDAIARAAGTTRRIILQRIRRGTQPELLGIPPVANTNLRYVERKVVPMSYPRLSTKISTSIQCAVTGS